MKTRTTYGGYAGFEFNNAQSNDLVFAVGKLIVNFGSVEFLTYQLINKLSEDRADHDAALDQLFVRRFELIGRLARKKSMPDEILADIETIRAPVKRLAAFRNKIAHNPIVRSSKGKDIEGETGSFGVIDVKSQKGREGSVVDVITLEQLDLGIDAVVELATNLHSIFDAVDAEQKKRDRL